MTENPYSPPKAPVADIVQSSKDVVRPASVIWALRLLWAGLGVGVINMMLAVSRAPGFELSVPFIIGVGTVLCAVIALVIWIIVKIQAGRNWARILILVLSLLSVPSFIMQLGRTFNSSMIDGVLHVLVNGSCFAAVALLFLGSSNTWFKMKRLS